MRQLQTAGPRSSFSADLLLNVDKRSLHPIFSHISNSIDFHYHEQTVGIQLCNFFKMPNLENVILAFVCKWTRDVSWSLTIYINVQLIPQMLKFCTVVGNVAVIDIKKIQKIRNAAC